MANIYVSKPGPYPDQNAKWGRKTIFYKQRHVVIYNIYNLYNITWVFDMQNIWNETLYKLNPDISMLFSCLKKLNKNTIAERIIGIGLYDIDSVSYKS